MSNSDQIAKFQHAVRGILEGDAGTKGYGPPEGSQPGGILYQFVRVYDLNHPLGEIVYKVVRYRSRHDPRDLLKISAWAYMEWANSQVGCHVKREPVRELDLGRIEDEQVKGPVPGTPQYVATPPDHLTPTTVPELSAVRRAYAFVEQEALLAYKARPKVMEADPLRLAALVVEEAGEALKAALDYTRPTTPLEVQHDQYRINLITELRQTAAMALIALAELGRRG
jgi:hypothetical protein